MDIGKLVCRVTNPVFGRLGLRVSRMDPDQERVISQYAVHPDYAVRRLAWIAGLVVSTSRANRNWNGSAGWRRSPATG